MMRMSPLDASFLHIEDPTSHMHIGSIAIFEGPAPAYDDVVAMIAGKLPLVPRYRQVVCMVPLQLGRPVWADDPHFTITFHVRHSALAAPGGDDELRHFVGRVMSQQLDRARPLWEIWVVEGLRGDRWALVSKTHHAMVDGVSGAELLGLIFDATADARPLPGDDWSPAPLPTAGELTRDALRSLMTSPYEQMRAARAALRRPRDLVAKVQELATATQSARTAVRSTPGSTLNGRIGPHRRWDFTSTSVEQVRAARSAHGGTFNDVVLAAITCGFRDLLLSRGESVDRVVRTMVPVSVRPRNDRGTAIGDGQLANHVSAMFADLPVGLEDPVGVLHAVSEQLDGLKDSRQAVAGEALVALSGLAMPMLLALGARAATRAPNRMVNTVTTNVPGPQIPLWSVGRRCLEMYPYVPIGIQMRVGIAIFSYDGRVGFGITGDYDTAADIDELARGIERGIGGLQPAAPRKRTRPAHRR
jgi:WS/DGAT/MGAT family acyltransferase